MTTRNVFEKVLKYCKENKIKATISHIYKGKGLSLQIWTASNVYFWIRMNDPKYCNGKPRTVITEEAFGVELERNGKIVDGSTSQRFSYKDFILYFEERKL